MKIKLYDVRKRCPDGELYTFKKGVAVVPGMRTKTRGAMLITLKEFNELTQGER